jgi:hypothetical protein
MTNTENRTDAQTTSSASTTATPPQHTGSCHCGAVRFAVRADLAAGASRCNCSICIRTGATGGIVKPDAFTLLAGEEHLASYEWGHKVSRRFFCKRCGIHSFARGHLAELGGDYVSVNYNCLDGVELSELKIGYWDGRHDNWYAGMRDRPWPILTPAAPPPAQASAERA